MQVRAEAQMNVFARGGPADPNQLHLALVGAAGPRVRTQRQVPTGQGACGSETRRSATLGLELDQTPSPGHERDPSRFQDAEDRA